MCTSPPRITTIGVSSQVSPWRASTVRVSGSLAELSHMCGIRLRAANSTSRRVSADSRDPMIRNVVVSKGADAADDFPVDHIVRND